MRRRPVPGGVDLPVAGGARRSETRIAASVLAVDERVERFPEPWRSRTREELAKLRADIGGMPERQAKRAWRTEAPPGG